MGHWHNRALADCFTTWRQWQRQQTSLRSTLQQAMQRWQAQNLAAAFDGWRAAAADAARLRIAAQSALRLFCNAALGKAFRSWQDVAQARQVRHLTGLESIISTGKSSENSQQTFTTGYGLWQFQF